MRRQFLEANPSSARPWRGDARADGILLWHTDLLKVLEPTEKQVAQQESGTHANEIETSMILYIDPSDRGYE